jgi:hypothetical protein
MPSVQPFMASEKVKSAFVCSNFFRSLFLEATSLSSASKMPSPTTTSLKKSITLYYPTSMTSCLMQKLMAGAVPLYLGAPNVAEFVPHNSFVDLANFEVMAG